MIFEDWNFVFISSGDVSEIVKAIVEVAEGFAGEGGRAAGIAAGLDVFTSFGH